MFDPNEYYQTIDGDKAVRYMIDNNVLMLRFKAATKYAIDDIDEALILNGFAGIKANATDTWLYYTAKDEKRHEHFQNGHNYIYAFSVSLTYETASHVDAFADAYASALTDDLDFELINGFFTKDELSVRIQVLMNEDQTYLVNVRVFRDSTE